MATKELAKQLGLVRKRSVRSAGEQPPNRLKSRQVFAYLIIIDFESTCWRDRKTHYRQEIIEFPAVLLNTSDGKIESEFHTYVQPQEHPILSEFCTELTGISQCQVEGGVPLKICLSQFSRWIETIRKEKKIVFVPGLSEMCSPDEKPCAFVTWSDWDLGVCLNYECKRKQLRKPPILTSWIDLRATYKKFYDRKPKGLNGALQDLGIEFSGREHSGLDDSRNTAHLAWRMICDGCVMRITKSLEQQALVKKSIVRAAAAKHEGHHGSSLTNHSGDISNETMHVTSHLNSAGNDHETAIELKIKGSEQDIQEKRKTSNDPKARLLSCFHPLPLETKVNHGNSSYQSLVSPRTLIDGLCAPLSLGKLQKPVKCLPAQSTIVSAPRGGQLASSARLVLASTTINSVTTSNLNMGFVSDSEGMLADWEDAAVLPNSSKEQNMDSDKVEGCDAGRLTPNAASLLALSKLSNRTSCPEKSSCYTLPSKPGQIVNKSPNTTIYNVREMTKVDCTCTNFKVPNPKVDAVKASCSSKTSTLSKSILASASNSSGLKREPANSSFCLPPSKRPFMVYRNPASPPSDSLPLLAAKGSFLSVAPLPSHKPSGGQNRLFHGRAAGKITPPLCKCGRRARRLHVSNRGPNEGEAFYSCPVGRSNEGKGKGCSYFKWERVLLKESSSSSSVASPLSLSSCNSSFSSLKGRTLAGNVSAYSQRTHLGLRPSMRT
nr:PREDICTED: ERI1 exoribonuclease 2 isoform X2 [Latimeria chalumnae]|eukprot:XP_005999680.1 PREDICTED: ERI1 exoribonuclease 2 isoform X2 [Latimeria chalumnae]